MAVNVKIKYITTQVLMLLTYFRVNIFNGDSCIKILQYIVFSPANVVEVVHVDR